MNKKRLFYQTGVIHLLFFLVILLVFLLGQTRQGIVLGALELAARGGEEKLFFPRAGAESQGFSPVLLQEMKTEVREREVYALLTLRHGYLLDEYYKEGFDSETIFPVASFTKTVLGTLVGIALDQDKVASLEAELGDYVTISELNIDNQGGEKGAITWKSLLNHTSGLEWYEWTGMDFSNLASEGNWLEYILGQALLYSPGEVFNYNTGGFHLLSVALAKAVDERVADYAQENLWLPLGVSAEKYYWQSDPQGYIDGGSGLALQAEVALRLGQLYLNGGEWNGVRVVSEEWIRESWEQVVETDSLMGEYGYGFWSREIAGFQTYFAMGNVGNYLFVVPELELVSVMIIADDPYYGLELLEKYLLANFVGESANSGV